MDAYRQKTPLSEKLFARAKEASGRAVSEKKRSFSAMLIGHVMDTDATNTIDRIAAKGARVSNFSLKISESDRPSVAILRIDAEEADAKAVLKELLNLQ
jgi:ACT domain-containing protein